ncbi:MAG TPA: DUF3175 domain-containing protein [Casimicrobiaceae bacterium]|nr:DUF3175 domain-containing protein [Casimicrobiaceae bacterium]
MLAEYQRMKSRSRWSQRVSQQSDALTLEKGVFSKRSSRAIASSLKRSAEHSRRRKSSPFQSAMSMLNFYINRAGRKMSGERRKVLERAKSDLRELFGKDR